MLETEGAPCEGNQLRPEHQELAEGAKLVAIAAAWAILTATVVISTGRMLLPRADAVAAERPEMIRADLR